MKRQSVGAVVLVIGMLLVAGLACSVTVSTQQFKNVQLIENATSDARARSYMNTDTFYLEAELADVKEDDTAEVRVVWRYTETASGDARDEVVAEETFEAANGPLLLELAPPDGGTHASGQYEVALYLDGRREESIAFKVR